MPGAQKPPLFSVVMPVYNVERYLRAALDSVFAQTYTDFEVIVINDGSTDSTQAIIDSYSDPRMRLYTQTNHRLVYTLNRGVKEARGTYIVRVDGDDICLPTRMAQQASYLADHPETVVLGSFFQPIDEDGDHLGDVTILPVFDTDIRRILCFGNAFGHGTITFRRDAAVRAGLYRDSFGPCEDYDLWRRMADYGTLHNLPESLYLYRFNTKGISAQQATVEQKYRAEISADIRKGGFPFYTWTAFRQAAARAATTSREAKNPAILEQFIAEQLHLITNLRRVKMDSEARRAARQLIAIRPRLAPAIIRSITR